MKSAAGLYQAGAHALAMDDPLPGAKPMRTAFGHDCMIAKAVKVLHLSFDDIGECYEPTVRMFMQVR